MISINIREFISELNEETEEIFDKFSAAIEGATRFAWGAIVDGTPIDTGRASASWNISVDSEEYIELTPMPSGNRVYYAYEPVFSFDILVNTDIFITNNVEYIHYLENGSARVAAHRMVANARANIGRSLNVRLTRIRNAR